MEHYYYMHKAIGWGERGRLKAPPNPWVGCLIVQEDRIVGQGYHHAFGQPHAEVMALQEAKESARGGVAYVSLEPCNHYGKTPPCTEALIKAGIKRVVIPIEDPDPKVAGQGIKKLREAGIEVIVGVCEKEARLSLAPYIHHRQKKTPYVVLKAAVSIDGKIADSEAKSQWITGESARKDVHLLRAQSQAILVGSNTVLNDNPKLTVRGVDEPFNSPLRVVLDRRGRLKAEGPLFDSSLAPTLIFSSNSALQGKGVEVLSPPNSLQELLQILGKRGVLQLLVEGGGELYSSFLKENLVDRLVLYMGPLVLGSPGKELFPSLNFTMESAPRFSLLTPLLPSHSLLLLCL